MAELEENSVELANLQKQIWEKAVETQMHFNEMCVKSRQLGLSFVVAALGLSVVLIARDVKNTIILPIPYSNWAIETHVACPIVLIAAAALYAVQRLDLGVYHRMLRGAVTFGEEFEEICLRNKLMKTPHGMTQFISLYSRHDKVTRTKNNSGNIYSGQDAITAESKIRKFYIYSIGSLLFISFAIGISFGSITQRHLKLLKPEAKIEHPIAHTANHTTTENKKNENP